MTGRPQLTFALTWQRNASPFGDRTGELLQSLGRAVGCTIVPRVAIAYQDIVPLFESGEVDLAWVPPISFLALTAHRLVRTLVVNQRHGTLAYGTVIASRAGGRYTSLDELRGARMAWVDPYSTTGYVLPLLDLVTRGIDPRTTFGEERFLGSHDAAARAVHEGRSDILGTFAEYEGDALARAGFSNTGVAEDWAVVLRGRESPSDVLAARATLDDDLCVALQAALVEMVRDAATRALVRDVLHVDAFGSADDARYAALAHVIASAQRDGLLPHL